VDGEAPTLTDPRCARVQGFSLHANPQVPGHRRDQLERLTQDAHGELVYTFTHPWFDGTTGMRLSPVDLLEKLGALVPLPCMHLARSGGCLAPHSHLREAIIPTPRQQGMADEAATDTASPRWSWARLLKRVFVLDMARCPFCQPGTLRIIAAITHGEVIHKIFRHLQLAADPPPITPARVRQEAFAWSSAVVPLHAAERCCADGPASCAPPQGVPLLTVCRTPCGGRVCTSARMCPRRSRRPSTALPSLRTLCISLFSSSSHVCLQQAHRV
jgi:hypothetical protein